MKNALIQKLPLFLVISISLLLLLQIAVLLLLFQAQRSQHVQFSRQYQQAVEQRLLLEERYKALEKTMAIQRLEHDNQAHSETPAVADSTNSAEATKPQPTAQKAVVKKHKTSKQIVAQHTAKLPRTSHQHYSRQQQEILQTNGKHYAIQLMADHNLEKIKQFAAKNNVLSVTTYYKSSLHHQKPMYVLIYGEYPSSQATMQAIQQLPIGLQRWSPFAKQYAEIQHEIRQSV